MLVIGIPDTLPYAEAGEGVQERQRIIAEKMRTLARLAA